MIDSIDKLHDIKDIGWLPSELVNNVKIILTVTTTSDNLDGFDSSPLLKPLKEKIYAQNFLFLSSFTQEQWEDVLTYGSGATNGALQLPESWKKSDEKAPIQAKVRWVFFLLTYGKILKNSFREISERQEIAISLKDFRKAEIIDRDFLSMSNFGNLFLLKFTDSLVAGMDGTKEARKFIYITHKRESF